MASDLYVVEYLTRVESVGAIQEAASPGWFRRVHVVLAVDEMEAARDVTVIGGVPVKVTRAKKPLPFFDRVPREYKQEFLQAVLYNISSGMSAGRALRTTIENENGKTRERLDIALRILDRGGSLAEAIRSLGFFDEATVAIVDAGERTGSVRQSIETAIDHYKSWAAGLKALFGIAGFIGFDFFSAITTVVAVRWQMLPMIRDSGIKTEDAKKIKEFNDSLDNAFLLNDILVALAVICGIVIVVTFLLLIADNEGPKRWIKRQIDRLPYLSSALRDAAISSSMRIAASLLRGGVQFASALEIIKKSSTNIVVRDYWLGVSRKIESGMGVGKALSSPMLTGSELISLMAHSNQLQLGDVLGRISDQRMINSQKDTRKFGFLSIGVTLLYIIASVGVALWAMLIQNSSMVAGV